MSTRPAGPPTSTHRQAHRDHRQRVDRCAAARSRSPRRPSRSTSSSAPRSGSARGRSTASPVEPEVRWLLDNFPGYWNWWRYMAIAALFQTHRFLVADEEWKAQGGHVNPLNDKMRDDLTLYIKAQTDGRQDLIDKLIPDYAPFSRRPVVDNGWYQRPHPRQRRARHRSASPASPPRASRPLTARSARSTRSSPLPVSRSSSTSGPRTTSARAGSACTTTGRRTARARTCR